jgi:membrane associated rhomboid family serine protease
MFPLRDDVPGRRPPLAVWALLFVNALIFLHEAQLSSAALEQFIGHYALVPARLTAPGGLAEYWPTLFTHMFLHGGWMHIIGNMWYLWIFGDNVEDRFGSAGFLILYLTGGLAAAALQIYVDPHATVPSLGASGAIAAVLGAYLVLYPKARVITLVPIFLFPWFVSIPAVVWLGLWFVQQYLSGLGSLSQGTEAGGVAYWAHVGGFLFGVVVGIGARWVSTDEPKTGARPALPGGRSYLYGYDRDWPFA